LRCSKTQISNGRGCVGNPEIYRYLSRIGSCMAIDRPTACLNRLSYSPIRLPWFERLRLGKTESGQSRQNREAHFGAGETARFLESKFHLPTLSPIPQSRDNTVIIYFPHFPRAVWARNCDTLVPTANSNLDSSFVRNTSVVEFPRLVGFLSSPMTAL
jgi:hypothetical protein